MKKKIRLTSKIYSIEFLAAMLFYSIGVSLSTPNTNPIYLKYLVMGVMLVIISAIILWISLMNSEKMDERARYNLSKASNLTIITAISFFVLLGVSLLALSLHIQLTAGIMSFVVAAMLAFHALSFLTFENVGLSNGKN
ncbi:hypothetical protein [Enterococcus sp. LJL90]